MQQLAAVLPKGGVLVEFQRHYPFDGTKPRVRRWDAARYFAFVLKANGDIEHVDLGLAKPLEGKI